MRAIESRNLYHMRLTNSGMSSKFSGSEKIDIIVGVERNRNTIKSKKFIAIVQRKALLWSKDMSDLKSYQN